jgi:hypothetical protein
VVLAVLALAAAVAFALLPKESSGGLTCTVSQNGVVVDTFALNEDGTNEEHRYGNYLLEVSSGQVRMETAPCANQDCVRTGWIDRAGQSIVCLPGRFVVELSAADGSADFDAIVK